MLPYAPSYALPDAPFEAHLSAPSRASLAFYLQKLAKRESFGLMTSAPIKARFDKFLAFTKAGFCCFFA